MNKLADLKQRLLADPHARREYEALETEFAIVRGRIALQAKTDRTKADNPEPQSTAQPK